MASNTGEAALVAPDQLSLEHQGEVRPRHLGVEVFQHLGLPLLGSLGLGQLHPDLLPLHLHLDLEVKVAISELSLAGRVGQEGVEAVHVARSQDCQQARLQLPGMFAHSEDDLGEGDVVFTFVTEIHRDMAVLLLLVTCRVDLQKHRHLAHHELVRLVELARLLGLHHVIEVTDDNVGILDSLRSPSEDSHITRHLVFSCRVFQRMGSEI